MKKEVKSAECPMCGSEFYEPVDVLDTEISAYGDEMFVHETVYCEDCGHDFTVKTKYKLEELESEVVGEN